MIEGQALRPVLEAAPDDAFDAPTVCAGWSVRDVLAHCGAALTRVAEGDVHRFTPEDNEADVAPRRAWPLDDVLAELFAGYSAAARAIDDAGGALDGVGLGEWMHGGDVREALGAERPYTSEGSDLALGLLLDRSALLGKPGVVVRIDGELHHFGRDDDVAGRLVTDLETFIRLCGNRRPNPDRYQLEGVDPAELVLFT